MVRYATAWRGKAELGVARYGKGAEAHLRNIERAMGRGRARFGWARLGSVGFGKGTEFQIHERTIDMATAVARRTKQTAQPAEVTRELISQWETRKPALKALNDATLDRPRGFALPKAEAVKLAGGEKEFQKVATYWKRSILWLRGITIEYEAATKAYRFIEVERHLTLRQTRISKSAERKHREEALRLGLVRDGDLENDHNRRLRVLLMNQHSETAGKIESQREFARLALIQPETLPRINGNGNH